MCKMLWRLPTPLRTLLATASILRNQARCSSTSRADDPLRILFCGSDRFSIASLDALVHAKNRVPGLIEEIHVAHRPAKPTGRGLKTLREGSLAPVFSCVALIRFLCGRIGFMFVWWGCVVATALFVNTASFILTGPAVK